MLQPRVVGHFVMRTCMIAFLLVSMTARPGNAQSANAPATGSTVKATPARAVWIQEPIKADQHIGFRGWHQIIYDSVQRKVLAWMAVSGCGDPWSNALWAYDSQADMFIRKTWSGSGGLENGNCVQPSFQARPANHPGDRHPYHQMAYDTKRGRLWIYSGVADSGKCDGSGPGNCDYIDMWYYDSRTNAWTCTDTGGGCNNRYTKMTNPGHRTEAAMVYDPDHDVIVLFGNNSDTWEFSPERNDWKRTGNGGPSQRNGDSMVYDSVDHKAVMFGGAGGKLGWLNDVWLYDAGDKKWKNPKPESPPPARKFPPLAYNSRRNLVLYYESPGNLWAYSVPANCWRKLEVPGGPVIPAVAGASMTYDPNADTLVLFDTHKQVWQLRLGDTAVSPSSSCG